MNGERGEPDQPREPVAPRKSIRRMVARLAPPVVAAILLGSVIAAEQGVLESGPTASVRPSAADATTATSPTAARSDVPGSGPLPTGQTYAIAPGDTLSQIAGVFGLTLEELLVANPEISDPNAIAVGQLITIPADSRAVTLQAATIGRTYSTLSLHLWLDQKVTLRVRADPGWSGDPIEWKMAVSPSEPLVLHHWGVGTLDGSGEATIDATEVGEGHIWRAFRVVLPPTEHHPAIVSKPIIVEWGGYGPCPARGERAASLHATAPGGTRYTLSDGIDRDYDTQWTLVASNLRGVKGTSWREDLDPCWVPRSPGPVVGTDGTLYAALVLRTNVPEAGPGPHPMRLLVVDPDGIRAFRDTPAFDLYAAPKGSVYTMSPQVNGHEAGDVPTTLAALGPDGLPRGGWPVISPEPISAPVFGPDGTLYLAQSSAAGDRLLAFDPDGDVKAGWPYAIDGQLAWTACGDGCRNVPRAPLLAPDGAITEAYFDGIYMVRPDGTAKPGWPYVMPAGTGLGYSGKGDVPGGGVFAPVLTPDGRIYLPRTDGRYAVVHDDMMCLRLDGSFCPGWPVALPDGWSADYFSVDADGTVRVDLLGNEYRAITIDPDGTVHE